MMFLQRFKQLHYGISKKSFFKSYYLTKLFFANEATSNFNLRKMVKCHSSYVVVDKTLEVKMT